MRDEDQKQIKEMREAFDSFREKALLREGQISRAYLEEAKALRKEYVYIISSLYKYIISSLLKWMY